MRILITGGAGFPGANLVRFLAERRPDYPVSCLDKKSVSEAAGRIGEDIFKKPGFSYWRGDISDGNTVGNLVRNTDAVIHLAARTGAPESFDDPRPFFETNVMGTLSLLEAARGERVKFLHISSADVYGDACVGGPAAEDSPLLPREPHGGSRAASESLVLCFERAYGIQCVVARPFNLYGPLQPTGNIIPDFITDALDDRPLRLPGDGTATRDWLFVRDFCEAADRIIHADFEEISGEIINLGTGKEKSMNEIAGAVLELLGRSGNSVRFVESGSDSPRRMAASVSKSELLTGWKPSVSMAGGLEQTVNWHLENQEWWRKRKKS